MTAKHSKSKHINLCCLCESLLYQWCHCLTQMMRQRWKGHLKSIRITILKGVEKVLFLKVKKQLAT